MATRKRATAKEVAPPAPKAPYQGPWYAIDPEWYEVRGHGLELIVRARRCPSCQAAATKGSPVRPSRSKGKATKARAPWEAEMQGLAACCALKERYITSDTPLLESVFRTLLAEKNHPLAFEELVERIGRYYTEGDVPKSVLESTLRRLLERQQLYGLKRMEALVPAA